MKLEGNLALEHYAQLFSISGTGFFYIPSRTDTAGDIFATIWINYYTSVPQRGGGSSPYWGGSSRKHPRHV